MYTTSRALTDLKMSSSLYNESIGSWLRFNESWVEEVFSLIEKTLGTRFLHLHAFKIITNEINVGGRCGIPGNVEDYSALAQVFQEWGAEFLESWGTNIVAVNSDGNGVCISIDLNKTLYFSLITP